MPVTLQDIADDLNLSIVTVSKALRNTRPISAATRERVLQRAKKLGYQTNWTARSLATGRTYTIGLLLPDFTHPFFAEIAKAVAQTIRSHEYHLIISYFEEDPNLEQKELDSLVARQVDGLIVAPAQGPQERNLFVGMRRRRIPFVLIDRPIAGVPASFVGVNNEAIGKMATQHLIEQGCRRIAYLRGPGRGIAAARLLGYRHAIEKHGLTVPPGFVVEAQYEDKTGHRAMQKLLRQNPIPDGVFCYNDPVAIGAMNAIRDAGLNIPQDIAVIGAGNVHYSDVLAVPLSTIDQSTFETGRQSAELLLEQIASKKTFRPRKIWIAPKLVVRESSRRLPA